MIESPAGAHRETTTPRSPQTYRSELAWLGLAVVLLAYAALAYGYLRLTPAWQNPDEPAHYTYVAFVAETGGLPELRQGDWDSDLLQRLKTGTLKPGDSISTIRYENWQPPLVYLLAAPVYRLGPTGDPAQVLPRLRAFDAALGAITLVLAYLVARELFAPGLALAVPLAMVGVPMFIAVSAALSADPLANLFAAALVLALLEHPARRATTTHIHAVTRDIPTLRWALCTGALLGFGLLTKLELGIFVPIALGVIATRSTQRVRDAAVVLVTAGVCVLPWLVHQVTTYGLLDPLALARHSQVVSDQPRFPGFTPEWLGQLLTVSFHSFWAQFGWMAIVAPVRLYVVWGIVAIAAVVGLVIAHRRLREPDWLLMLATVLIACVAYVGYNLAFEQFQARYVFTALTPIAALLVLGWSALVPRRAAPLAVLVLTAALVALNAYTLLRVLVPGFAPPV